MVQASVSPHKLYDDSEQGLIEQRLAMADSGVSGDFNKFTGVSAYASPSHGSFSRGYGGYAAHGYGGFV